MIKQRFMNSSLNLKVTWVSMLLLALAPVLIHYLDEPFILDLMTRMVILSIAAVSLNLILGYGGMISFGHAAYLGIGAYCVGIPAYYDHYGALQQLLAAILVSAAFALATGFVCLRTRGVYFIMITMAFSQMVFFAMVSIEEYGGDDGLVIYARSELGGPFDLENNTQLYYFCLGFLAAALYLVSRLMNSRFGMVVRGSAGNDGRMQSMGYPTFRYRLTACVTAGVICGIAGWLLGNFTSFISPEMMDWTRSGELIFMVVLGGAGSLFGPVLGTAAFITIEELLSGITIYWQLLFGIFLILVVLFGKGGLSGLIDRLERRK